MIGREFGRVNSGEKTMSLDKGKAIESALAQIEKKFGKGSIMRLGERPIDDIGAISTNCLSLDAAIGVGGFPRGRIVEVYGPESSGKTTLALQVVASAHAMAAFVPTSMPNTRWTPSMLPSSA